MMIKVYQSAGGSTVSGNAEDLDLVSSLVRARLYFVLGPNKGEDYFRKLPAYPLMMRVAREIQALQDQ